MSVGLEFIGTLSIFLLFLIKVLFILFISGLVIGITITIKSYLFTPEDIEKIRSTFRGKKAVAMKRICSTCSKEIDSDWKFCPHCTNAK